MESVRASARRRAARPGVSASLKVRAAGLLQQEIRFVYCPDFESCTSDRTVVANAESLLQRLERPLNEGGAPAPGSGKALTEFSLIRGSGSRASLLAFEDEQLLFRTMNLLRYRVSQQRARLSAVRPVAKLVAGLELMLDLVARIRSQLVSSNVRLVASIARKFSPHGSDFDEFSSDGCLVLLGAIDRFDYSRGFRFSTYATHSIQRHFFRLWKARGRNRDRVQSLDASVLNAVPQSPAEVPEFDDPERIVAQLMSRAEDILDDREQRILWSRFGLKPGEVALTLREIATDMGISKERVRQLQLKALEKLRTLLPAELPSTPGACAVC